MRVLVALLLVSAALAGCASQDRPSGGVSPPGGRPLDALTADTHKFGEFLATSVASFDGTSLHIDIQLPDGQGPFPTLLTDTPYSLPQEDASAAEMAAGQAFRSSYTSYVARGYAVATGHVRGTGESGGCLTIGAPEEGRDGYALVEWIANQSWSNGKVAMIGTSYDGTTPLETAVWQPPHLTTIVPISPVTEWYRYYFELGTHRRGGEQVPGADDTDPALWAALGVVPGPRTGATGGPADAQCPLDYTLEDDSQDDYDSYWHARDHHAKAGLITAPMLFAHGWEDLNVAPSGFPSLWANVTSEKRIWLEQHGHGVPSSKTAYLEYQHRWLDYWLLGKQNGALLLPPVVIEDNQGKFRTEQDWPPSDAVMMRYNLSSDEMGIEEPAVGSQYHYVDDASGNGDPAVPVADFVSFATPALSAPMHLAGAPVLHVSAVVAGMDTQFDANLYDLAPDGSASYVSRGFLDARHRDSLDHGTAVASGQRDDFQFPLHFNDHIVPVGHRLQLVVKSSDDYVQRSPYRATIDVDIKDGRTWLALPLVPDSSRTFLDAAPTPWGA